MREKIPSPNSKKYGVPLYSVGWVLDRFKDRDRSSDNGEASKSTRYYVVSAGGGGEGRSGIPNAVLISSFDSDGNSLSDHPVLKLDTRSDLPYRTAVHPNGDGVLCSFPNGCLCRLQIEEYRHHIQEIQICLDQLEDDLLNLPSLGFFVRASPPQHQNTRVYRLFPASPPQHQNTKVYRRRWTRKRDPDFDPSNRIIDIITQDSRVVNIVVCDVQGGSLGPEKVAKGLAKKKTHKGAKGGTGRERSISGGRDGEAIRDINSDCDPAPHIQKTGRPQVGLPFSQANGGVEGRDESWDGLESEKGSGGRDGGSIGGGQEEEAVPDIKMDCHPTLHIERNRRPEVGFGVSQANGSVERQGESPDELKWESGSESTCGGRDQERGKSGGSEFRDEEGEGSGSVESRGGGGEGSGFGSECRDVKGEGSGSVESECRDAEGGEGSRSGANQDGDGEGEGTSSGGSQGQDREEGSASGENQGRDRNAEGSGSNEDEDEDEDEHQGRVGGDIEQGIQENNQEEINFSGIPEAFLAIIGGITIAALEFHNRGAISSTTLGRLIAVSVVGFLCCMASMLERNRKSLAARVFGTIGAAAGGLGFLLLVSENFSSYYGWMILGLGSLAILLICVWAFRR